MQRMSRRQRRSRRSVPPSSAACQTCDTAPPYFALNETAVGEYRTFAKLSPPLRSEWDRRAIVDGLKDGTIDAIASDHAPQDQDSKRLPFTSAAPGIIGLETMLPLALERGVSPHRGGAAGLAHARSRRMAEPDGRRRGMDGDDRSGALLARPSRGNARRGLRARRGA